jgi:hypothetical protein
MLSLPALEEKCALHGYKFFASFFKKEVLPFFVAE